MSVNTILTRFLPASAVRSIRRIRTYLRSRTGKALYYTADAKISGRVLGGGLSGEYGAWWVAPSLLSDRSVIYSFGIGEDLTFDCDLVQQFGCTVHAFDPTPRSLQWIAKQQLPSNIKIHPYGLAAIDGYLSFFPPRVGVSFSVNVGLTNQSPGIQPLPLPVKRLKTIMTELGHQTIDLLKIDIEGAEYDVINDLLNEQIA